MEIVRRGGAYTVTFTPHGDWPPAPASSLGAEAVVRLLQDVGIRAARINQIMDDLRACDRLQLPIVIVSTAHRRRFGL